MEHPVCTDMTTFYVTFNERKKIFNKMPRFFYANVRIRRNIYLNIFLCLKNGDVSTIFIIDNTITHVAIS